VFTGHVGVVVDVPRYQQKYVWDIHSPLYPPTVLKRLSSYVSSCLKGKKSRLYVYHLHGPVIESAQILRRIKTMGASIHYKAQTCQAHLNYCMQTLLGLPGIPNFLPRSTSPDLHYCSSAVITLLVHLQILQPSILDCFQEDTVFYPQLFLAPEWDFNSYVTEGYQYELEETTLF
jgi:hypothetical protein